MRRTKLCVGLRCGSCTLTSLQPFFILVKLSEQLSDWSCCWLWCGGVAGKYEISDGLVVSLVSRAGQIPPDTPDWENKENNLFLPQTFPFYRVSEEIEFLFEIQFSSCCYVWPGRQWRLQQCLQRSAAVVRWGAVIVEAAAMGEHGAMSCTARVYVAGNPLFTAKDKSISESLWVFPLFHFVFFVVQTLTTPTTRAGWATWSGWLCGPPATPARLRRVTSASMPSTRLATSAGWTSSIVSKNNQQTSDKSSQGAS